MAIHDPRTPGTANYIEIINSDGTMAQACGNGMRCVVQALAAESGQKLFTFETIAGILNAEEHADGTISVDWRLRGEDDEWHPWMSNTFTRTDG